MLSPERFINVCGFSNWTFLPPAFSVALSPLNFRLQLRLETEDKESAKSHAALCRFRSYCFPVLPKKATNSIKSMAKYYREAVSMSTNSLWQRRRKNAHKIKRQRTSVLFCSVKLQSSGCRKSLLLFRQALDHNLNFPTSFARFSILTLFFCVISFTSSTALVICSAPLAISFMLSVVSRVISASFRISTAI